MLAIKCAAIEIRFTQRRALFIGIYRCLGHRPAIWRFRRDNIMHRLPRALPAAGRSRRKMTAGI